MLKELGITLHGVEQVTLLIRHFPAVQGPEEDARTLVRTRLPSIKPIVVPFYADLVRELSETYGPARYGSSTRVRSIIGTWEMFGPAHIFTDIRLDCRGDFAKLESGSWYPSVKDLSLHEQFQAFIRNPSFVNHPDFLRDSESCDNYIRDPVSRLKVAVVHEIGISLSALRYVDESELGLQECESVLFYVTGGRIVGADKVVPFGLHEAV